MSSDPRRGIILDYFGERPCNDPMTLGRLMDRVCHGRAPSLLARVTNALAHLRKKIAR
jgi:hypothetical protein